MERRIYSVLLQADALVNMAANVKQQLAQLANLSHSKDVIDRCTFYFNCKMSLKVPADFSLRI